MASLKNGMHDLVPTTRYENEGLAVPRLLIHSDWTLVDLLDDLTGNVITHVDSAGAAVAGEPDVESATPTARRGSGNYIEYEGQSDAGEYMQIAFATAQNLEQYNFLGFWRQSDTNTLVTDYDLEFLDANGAVITSFNLPAATASVWQFVEIDISDVVRDAVKYIRIVCDVADNDVIDYESMIAYTYGNGAGPVFGTCGVYTSTGAITRGDLVVGVQGRPGYVAQAENNGVFTIGKALNTVTGADEDVIVQETGEVYIRCSGTTVAAGDQAVPSSATTADDDTTAGSGFGMWKEASATAGADLLVRLGIGGIGGAAGGVIDHTHVAGAGDSNLGSVPDPVVLLGAPTISDYTNATHTHEAAGTGGLINNRVSIKLTDLRETDATNVPNLAGHGGILASDSTPALDYTNGDTDSTLQVLWVATNQDPVVFQFDVPADYDETSDWTVSILGVMSAANDTPVIDLDIYFTQADGTMAGKVSDATAVFTDTQAVKTATIANVDIPASATTCTIEMTPGAHGADSLAIQSIQITVPRA